jgi:hypothetical protein
VKKAFVTLLIIVFVLAIAYFFFQHLQKQEKSITKEVLEKGQTKGIDLVNQKSVLRFAPSNSFFLIYFNNPENLINSTSETEIYKKLIGEETELPNENASLIEKGKEALNEASAKLKSEFFKKLLGEESMIVTYPTSNQNVEMLAISKPTVKPDYIQKSLEYLDLPSKEDNVIEKIQFIGNTITSVKEKKLNILYFFSFAGDLAIFATNIDIIKAVIESSAKNESTNNTILDNPKFKKLQTVLSSGSQGFYYLDYEGVSKNLDGIFKRFYLEDVEKSKDAFETKETIREYMQNYFCILSYGELLVKDHKAKLDFINDFSQCPKDYERDFVEPKNFNPSFFDLAPTDSTAIVTGFYDFAKYKESFESLKKNPDAGMLQTMIDGIEKSCGENISKICSNIEEQYLFEIAGLDLEGMFPIPLINLVLKFKNKPENPKMIDETIKCLITTLMNQKGEMTPGTSAYKNFTINYFPVPFLSINISYVFIDNYLVLGTSIDSVKKVIDVFKKDQKNINANTDFNSLLQVINKKDGTLMSFYNLKEIGKAIKTLVDYISKMKEDSKPPVENLNKVYDSMNSLPALMTHSSHHDVKDEINAVLLFE